MYDAIVDIEKFKKELKKLPKFWDGKECVLKLKEADYNWRQMEWWAFYFEFEARKLLKDICSLPDDTCGSTTFDLKTDINWDLKAKAIKSDETKVILNDKSAMETSIKRSGFHGEIIALCDVKYNDENRTFQKWHSALKGGLSDYEKKRRSRTSASRYRKTEARLCEIVYVCFSKNDLANLGTMNQGRNANGTPRPSKYTLDLEELDNFQSAIQEFTNV